MKKLISVALSLVAFSGASMAADGTPILVGTTPETQLNPVSCPNHMDANVSLNPSQNVKMAFNCYANAPTVRIGTCHTAGLVKSRSEKVLCGVATGTDSTQADAGDVACDTTGDTTTYKIVTGTGSAFYTASTGGGSLGASVLNTDTCDTAGAKLLTKVTQP